jgi:hypothetical protein
MRFTLVDLSSTGALSDVVLVDSEDKFHEPDFGTEGVDSVGALGRSSRNIWPFDLPDKVDIKRIRVTPTLGDPFSIDWTGVPEVISSKITFKFYGIARVPSISGRYDELDALDADIKITNNGKNTTVIDSGKFVIIDQFDFPYASSTTDSVKLLPGESMRVSIKFESVSMLSRPVFLIYRPENLSMDISAWA